MTGLLIGLEGIDASGKSTVVSLLEKKLIDNGISAKKIYKKYIDYPDKRIADYTLALKHLIWHDVEDPYYFVTSQGWLFKHALWYSILVENFIKPNIDKFDLLLVDGWFYKMYSRFLLKEEFNKKLLNSIYNSIRKCDHVFMLDASPSICWSRREKFKCTEMGAYDFRVEDPYNAFIEYQIKVRNKLLALGKKDGWTILKTDKMNANETTDALFELMKSLDLTKYLFGT